MMNQLHCTVSQRILIHLLDYLKNEETSEVPIEVTQEGIAKVICVNRKHIPRSIKKLQSDNFITEQRNHVKGKKQMMKTYSLTEQGRFQAIRIKNELSDHIVYVIKNEKKTQKSISDVFEIFNRKYSYACIISQVIKHCLFDERNIILYSTKKKRTASIHPENIYRSALEEAWKDGVLTVDERNLLKNLRDTLHISKETHYKIQHKILQSKQFSSSEMYRQVYDLVLTEVLKDSKISKDEEAILKKLKKHFNINDE
jgi:predicted regulator of amino acid metabolism with ACT domain